MFSKKQHLLVHSCSVAKATNGVTQSLSFRPISKIQLALHAVYAHSALYSKIKKRLRILDDIMALSTRLLVK